MDNEKLVFVDADFSIEKFSTYSAKDTSVLDPWETDDF